MPLALSGELILDQPIRAERRFDHRGLELRGDRPVFRRAVELDDQFAASSCSNTTGPSTAAPATIVGFKKRTTLALRVGAAPSADTATTATNSNAPTITFVRMQHLQTLNCVTQRLSSDA